MIFQEPPRTAYDLAFQLGGFPIRIHPAFFILPVLFGSRAFGGDVNPGVTVLIFVAVFLVSILLHELAHSIVMKLYGINSHIVLYWFGGLAIPSAAWGRRKLSSWQDVAISAAGPLANFAIAGLAIGVVLALGGRFAFELAGIIPFIIPDPWSDPFNGNLSLWMLAYATISLNVLWGVFNLVPVFPLDGGQIARAVIEHFDPRGGYRTTLMVSTIAAAMLAVFTLQSGGMMWIFFAYMAFSSYMMWQQSNFSGPW